MFYSLLSSLLLLAVTTAYAQPSNLSVTVVQNEYKAKFISDCLQSLESTDPKFTLTAKSSYCGCFYGKLLSRYGFENLTSMDSIIRRSDESVRNFAKVVWSPEMLACNRPPN